MSGTAAKQPVFSGEFRHTMDNKHRVTIPARWRQGEQDEFFLIPSHNNQYLYALPPAEFENVNTKVQNDPNISPANKRVFARQYFSKAQHCVIDRQGRLLLPDDFCRLAGLDNEIMLAGAYSRFEIWNPERWSRARVDEETAYQDVAEQIGL